MPLPTFPKAPGDQDWSAHGVVGPASYTVITPGTPLSGGQLVPASAFGLQNIVAAWPVSNSNDGTYAVHVFLSPYEKGGSSTSIALQWLTAATGAEVAGATNLSARTVRIMAVGN